MAKEAEKIKALEDELSSIKTLLEMFAKNGFSNISNNDANRDIIFISLYPGILNLSTESNGKGSVYTFKQFGEEQSIPFVDAKAIVKHNRRFIEEGKCYIGDESFVDGERLSKDYAKLLNREDISKLLNKDKKSFVKIFETMTKSQKEILASMIAENAYHDKNSIDMNIVQIINDDLEIDIMEEVSQRKALMQIKDN